MTLIFLTGPYFPDLYLVSVMRAGIIKEFVQTFSNLPSVTDI